MKKQQPIELKLHSLTLKADIGRYADPNGEPDYFRVRPISFTITDGDGYRIADADLEEWRATWTVNWNGEDDYDGPNNELGAFAAMADERCGKTFEIADAIADAWLEKYDEDNSHPFEKGNLVIFSELNIKARTPEESTAVWTLIKKFLVDQFPPRRVSMIVLKAAPLREDYNASIYGNKTRALMRLYNRRINAVPFPDLPERHDDGFMWIPVRDRFGPGERRRTSFLTKRD